MSFSPDFLTAMAYYRVNPTLRITVESTASDRRSGRSGENDLSSRRDECSRGDPQTVSSGAMGWKVPRD